MLNAYVLAPSACGGMRAQLQRNHRKGTCVCWQAYTACIAKEMVNISVAAGCSNTPSDRVSVFKLVSQ